MVIKFNDHGHFIEGGVELSATVYVGILPAPLLQKHRHLRTSPPPPTENWMISKYDTKVINENSKSVRDGRNDMYSYWTTSPYPHFDLTQYESIVTVAKLSPFTHHRKTAAKSSARLNSG